MKATVLEGSIGHVGLSDWVNVRMGCGTEFSILELFLVKESRCGDSRRKMNWKGLYLFVFSLGLYALKSHTQDVVEGMRLTVLAKIREVDVGQTFTD